MQEKQENMTETEKEMMQEELTSLQQRIQKAQRSAQEDIRKQRQELLQPIKDKIDNAVQKVAEEEGYTYVLYERSLPYSGGEDLTGKIKEQLEEQRSGGGTSEQ
jgi:outer membrane protein